MPFRDVVGHRRATELLARSIQRDVLPPSLLFAGPGAVTRDVAIAVAQALNCIEADQSVRPGTDTLRLARPEPVEGRARSGQARVGPYEIDSCGRCSTCTRIARGIHPDVLVVEPGDSGSIKIEQVRDVVDRSSYRPFEGRRRVVIVTSADALVPQAQNALLKTLEEPPPSSVFILLTSHPDMLLATVRSRLIRLAFAETGPVDADPDAREVAERALARAAAGGDPGRRLEAAQELLAHTGRGSAQDREQVASHLRAVSVLLRDVAVLASGASDRLLAQPDSRQTLDRLLRTFRGERGLNAFFAVDRAMEALERNVGMKVVADWVALQL
jgi:DNA polymerase III subunit delta'